MREVQEEIGLTVAENQLVYAGIQLQVVDSDEKNGLQKNREHAHTYFLRDDIPLADYQLQNDELDGIYTADIAEVIAVFSEEKAALTLTGYSFIDEVMAPDQRTAVPGDFLSHGHHYYIKIAIMAERLLAGKPIAI